MAQIAVESVAPFPLTEAERRRAVAVLSAIGSRTLLQTLAHLNVDHDDAGLIIAALLDRLPADDPPPDA